MPNRHNMYVLSMSWLVPEEHLPPRLARDDKEDKWAAAVAVAVVSE